MPAILLGAGVTVEIPDEWTALLDVMRHRPARSPR